MITEIPEDVHAVVASVSRQLRSRYQMCEYPDIQQELYLWYLGHHQKVAEWVEEHSPRTVERLLAKSLRNAGEKYCRKEKAEVEGYEVDDEFYYSIPMVAELLQLYFDPEWMIPRAIELGSSSSGTPPEEGGNLQAMVADVGRAYEAMPPHDQFLLASIYDGAVPVREAIAMQALDWGVPDKTASLRIRRVVGRVRTKLGGARPYVEEA